MKYTDLTITLDNISKKYGYQTIIQDVSISIPSGNHISILGRNGAGKSTLLKIISSYLSPSSGSVTYTNQGKTIAREDIANEISFSAPYIKTTQEFTLRELLDFHALFKPLVQDLDYQAFLDVIQLSNPKEKQIRQFSSGMQQKVYLALCIMSQASVIMLDEPTSYLDEEARSWYHDLLGRYVSNRTVIIASNEPSDFLTSSTKFHIENKTLS